MLEVRDDSGLGGTTEGGEGHRGRTDGGDGTGRELSRACWLSQPSEVRVQAWGERPSPRKRVVGLEMKLESCLNINGTVSDHLGGT